MITFGTGGWRALIGEEFTKNNVLKVAQAVANVMLEEEVTDQSFILGYDRRFLSEKASKWFAEVLAGNHIPVRFIEGYVPTSVVMYKAKVDACAYSVCITASHNPADYNGIKLFVDGGKDADEVTTKKIESQISLITDDQIKTMPFELAVAESTIELINPMNEFVDTIIHLVDIESIKKAGLKVLIDPMFGVAKNALQTVLVNGRCEVDVINDAANPGFGGVMPSPNATSLYRLKHMVANQGYDIGIGTDGDADRLGIIDEKGNFIHPNEVLVMLYYYLMKYKNCRGSVVRNIATTHLLDKIAVDYNQKCFEVPVGFKHISAQMEADDALIGGESSGGLTIRGHIKGKDGIFASTLLVEMISVTGKKLSELLDEIYSKYGYYYTHEDDCHFLPEQKLTIYGQLYNKQAHPDFTHDIEKVSYRDGVKVYFKNGGWAIARFSGTEPLIRIFSEMEDQPTAEAVVKEFKRFLSL